MATTHISRNDFISKVWDFENSPSEWVFKGERPAIIDFYAPWCGPCKMLSPVLEKISEKYAGTIDIYKVDTDEEIELASAFGIMSVPSILFIPKEGTPTMAQGFLPEVTIDKIINDNLL